MTSLEPHQAPRENPPPWGCFTPLRNKLATWIAGPVAARPLQPRRKCTIMKVDRLGDFILATGAIHALLAHFGHSECALVVSEEVQALAEREFPGVPCHVVPAFKQKLFREIARAHRKWTAPLEFFDCEHLVCLRHQRSVYRDLILRAIPCQRLWWLERAPFSDSACLALAPAECSYTEALPDPFTPREVSAHRLLVSRVIKKSLPIETLRPHLRASATLAPVPSIVIAPLAGDPIRNVPSQIIWGALAQSLNGRKHSIVLSGRQDQKESLIAFRNSAPDALFPMTRIEAEDSFEGWIARLQSALLVITGDSASAHLATALDRPLVAVAGGGHPAMFSPQVSGNRQRWFTRHVPCEGCDWQCIHPEPICITQINVNDLARAIDELLPGSKPAP